MPKKETLRIQSAQEDNTFEDFNLDDLSPGARALVDKVGILEVLNFAQSMAAVLIKAREIGIPHEVQTLGLGCLFKSALAHPNCPPEVTMHAEEIAQFCTSAFLAYMQKKYGKEMIPFTGRESKEDKN